MQEIKFTNRRTDEVKAPDRAPSLSDGPFFCPIGPCKHRGKIHVCDFFGQGVINIGLEIFGERCFLVLLAINSFKNTGIIIVHDLMHSKLMHGKASDRRCPFMHSKRKKTPRCLGSRNITSFKVCFNFIVVLPFTIKNNHMRIVLLTMPIRLPFDNGNSTVRTLVHILVQVLNSRYGRTYLHVMCAWYLVARWRLYRTIHRLSTTRCIFGSTKMRV